MAGDQWGAGNQGGFGFQGSPQWAPEPAARRTAPAMVFAIVAIVVLVAIISVLGTVLWFTTGGFSTQSQASPSTSTQFVTAEAEPEQAGSPSTMAVSAEAAPAAPVVPATPSGAYLCSTSGSAPFARAGAGSSATSCPFAGSVRDSYRASGAGGGAATISAYSPVTGTSYTMYCAPAGTNVVQCTGGNNAVVYVY